jgi:hypothetical protein
MIPVDGQGSVTVTVKVTEDCEGVVAVKGTIGLFRTACTVTVQVATSAADDEFNSKVPTPGFVAWLGNPVVNLKPAGQAVMTPFFLHCVTVQVSGQQPSEVVSSGTKVVPPPTLYATLVG